MKRNISKKSKKKPAIKILQIVIPIVLAAFVVTGIVLYLAVYRPAALLTAADMAQSDKVYSGGVKAIGMVNGEPFFQSDLDVYALELRAAVAAHYGRKYNLGGMGASFWETKYGGQTPREFLEKLARDDLVHNMVLIQEARKRGIDTPAVYRDLEDEREAWNEPTDEIVYGPKTLGPAEYNSYRITGIRDELKTALLGNELAPTVAQLRAAYNSLDDGMKIAPTFVNGIRFYWDEDAGSDDAIRSMLQQGIENGTPAEELVETLSDTIPGLAQEEFDMNSRYVSKEDPYQQELASMLQKADKGSFVTGPEEIPNPEGKPELFYITSKEGGHVMPFEEAPGLGRNKWINDQYEIFMQKKVKEARVTLFNMNKP